MDDQMFQANLHDKNARDQWKLLYSTRQSILETRVYLFLGAIVLVYFSDGNSRFGISVPTWAYWVAGYIVLAMIFKAFHYRILSTNDPDERLLKGSTNLNKIFSFWFMIPLYVLKIWYSLKENITKN